MTPRALQARAGQLVSAPGSQPSGVPIQKVMPPGKVVPVAALDPRCSGSEASHGGEGGRVRARRPWPRRQTAAASGTISSSQMRDPRESLDPVAWRLSIRRSPLRALVRADWLLLAVKMAF